MPPNECQTTGTPVTGNLAVCAFIERSPLFKGVAREELQQLFEAAKLLKLPAQAIVFREGDSGAVTYLIMSGSVQVSSTGKAGDVALDQLKRGALLGEVTLLTGRPRTATVTTLEAVELIALPNPALEGFLRQHPKARKLIQALVEGRVKTAIERATGN